jgi:hypothetical protein
MKHPVTLTAIALALVPALVFVPARPARSWGSVTSPDFNTHACIGTTAYKMLQGDPAFRGAAFPKIDAIEAHEGVDRNAHGSGPDAEGATDYSEHYFNPRNGEGRGPKSVGDWFVRLASVSDQAKSAAWSAHFLADLSVIYHTTGESAADVEQAYKERPDRKTLILPAKVYGDLELLSRPLISSMPTHGADFKTEADRFRAEVKGKPAYDWFDPWYWNGLTASPVSSSHLVWEGLVSKCPSSTTGYSDLWPGNPEPQFEHPILAMRDVVVAFARANARNTVASKTEFFNDPQQALTQATDSVFTMWRASITGLRTNLGYELDPSAMTGKSPVPVFKVSGKFGNFAKETPSGAEVRLSVASGTCKVLPEGGAEKQPVPDASPGVHPAGQWRVEVPEPDNCRLLIEAIGKFTQTPDLQYTWKHVNIRVLGLDGTYKGRFNVTEAHYKLSPEFYTIGGDATFVVSKGVVTGTIKGRYDCGSGLTPFARLYCGPFEGTIKGTVDQGGAMKASFSGTLHGTTTSGKADDEQMVGDVTGDFKVGAGKGAAALALIGRYVDSRKIWPISGPWTVTRSGK